MLLVRYFYLSVRMVLKLCDELDKAKELNDYFKQTLEKHIAKEILPHLQKLKQETLIKEFVKQWKDFTILVHYLRKMFSYLVLFSHLPFRTVTTSKTPT